MNNINSKKILIIILILANVYVWHLIFEFYFLKSSVNFLNVYEGDSTLLINRSGNFLIDAGRRNYVLKQLPIILPFFEKTIDVVMISHADSDHFEGLNFILDNYRVRLVVLNDFDNTNDSYSKLLNKIIDKNVKIVLGVEGTKIKSFDLDTEIIYPSKSQLMIDKTNEKSQLVLIKTMDKN
jgi:competence protein ComEC